LEKIARNVWRHSYSIYQFEYCQASCACSDAGNANSVAIKFSKYIEPKKEHKKLYSRRASNVNTISTTNQIAVNKALSEVKKVS